eukprot:TRINITY_DN232_c0_g4_i1.p2 TRINITY_DN232_c0_g4~~TRINITY_DN232_c0_g4_i1.p2  ORF type:complete len:743 (+),score=163.18 TRINITY_DN232_c0_g4_i1:75-2303(+)
MLVAVAATAAAVAGDVGPTCTVNMTKYVKGDCGGHAIGCGMGPDSAKSMHVNSGCCGYFTCDGYANTYCCAQKHSSFQWCVCGPKPTPQPAGDFFVEKGAAPGGTGGKGDPFGSIQECVNVAAYTTDLSTCRVGAGEFNETVVLPPSGCNIVGAGPGKTVLKGAESVTGKFQRTSSNGAIYTLQVSEDLRGDFVQLFLDGVYIPEARWPNAQLSTMTSRSVWSTMDSKSAWGLISDPALPKLNWTGARATMLVGTKVLSWVKPVLNTFDNGTVQVRGDFNSLKSGTSFNGALYWMAGKLELLDSPGEWYYDASTNTLYVWAPDSKDPTGRVSVKRRDYCLDARRGTGKAKLFSQMTFNGCTFAADNANGVQFTDLELVYPTYDPLLEWRNQPSGSMPAGTIVSGDGNLIERVTLQHSNIWGFYLIGNSNTIRETYVGSTDWVGSLDTPPITIGFTSHNPGGGGWDGVTAQAATTLTARPSLKRPFGASNLIERVTVRYFGNSGIVTSQMSNEIRLSHVHEGGLLGGDDACIHAANPPTDCTNNNCSKHWHHNWVHNCREKCVRCDDNSRNCTLHHMVVFNCGEPLHNGAPAGILLKGQHNQVYQSTIFNQSEGQGGLVPRCKGENKDFEYWNNALCSVRSNCEITNTTFPFAEANFVNKTWTSFGLEDPMNYRFKPVGSSPLIAQGTPHAPLPDLAASPIDIGAYQSRDYGNAAAGEYNATDWRPGCTFSPLCFEYVKPWPN